MFSRKGILQLFTGRAAVEQTPLVQAIQQLTVGQHDVIVLHMNDRAITAEIAEDLRTQLIAGLGPRFNGVPVIVLSAGTDISVMRRDDVITK